MRSTSTVLLFLVGAAWAAAAPYDSKIVGGVETTIENVPYQLEMDNALLGVIWSFSCGAVIVGERSVLTAGHCVEGVNNKKNIRFRSGSTTRGEGTIHTVENFILHPQYSDLGGYADYDIAYVEITPAFDLGATRQIIAVAQEEPVEGDNCTVSGWGVTSEGGSNPPTILREVTVPYLTREVCTAEYAGEATITDRMICAGLEKGGKDSCSGDSGGPFVVNGILTGLVSWGYGCAEAGHPGVYTNVAYFADWVQEQINATEAKYA